MTFTEEEAMRHACAREPFKSKCCASGCMAWRWAQKPNPDWKPSEHGTLQWPQRDMRHDQPAYIDDTTRGYCGLGGRP